jgi:hypothetical protein
MPFALVLPEDEDLKHRTLDFLFLSLLRVIFLCYLGIDFLFDSSYVVSL